MVSPGARERYQRCPTLSQLLSLVLCAGLLFKGVHADHRPHVKRNWQADFMRRSLSGPAVRRGPPKDSDDKIPLVITNKCETTMWPGITTQAGTGPGTGGFELGKGKKRELSVSPDWQGRVWGRTNCTVDGDSCSCDTGDCSGKMSCELSGATPATLAEFTLAGGINGTQTFYDISLVDGYNIPIGINHIPSKNTSFIPPNLTNCACIATSGWLYDASATGTYYTNSTYPIPLEDFETNDDVRSWCPWPLLAFPPTKPGDGIYPYPDDNIQRPLFSPCKSACAASGSDKDCCVGKYHDPDVCKPSAYSRAAKAICPDAYSFAFDDQESTFIIPKGGGWEVVLCPEGRSTNILRQLGSEMSELAASGVISAPAMKRLSDTDYILADRGAAGILQPVWSILSAAGVMVSLSLVF